ncbi:MAG: ABC transporter permease subunit, partial [Thermoplasmata archaeon]
SLLSVESAASSFPISSSAIYYYDGTAYHLLIWTYDAGGDPVADVSVRLGVSLAGEGEPPTASYSATGNAQGELQFVIPAPDQGGTVLTVESVALATSRPITVSWGDFLSPGFFLYLSNMAPGSVEGINQITMTGTGYYSSQSQVLLFAAGPNGSAPVGLSVMTCSFSQPPFPGLGPPRQNCTGLPTQSLGAADGYWSHYPLPSYPAGATGAMVEVVNSSGFFVESITFGLTAVAGGGSTYVSSAPGASILSSFTGAASFFLPLTALVATYWTYARTRLSGALEPILARPVTRRGIFLSRYAAVALALVVAVLAEVWILDAGASGLVGEPIPAPLLVALVGGSLVAALGFAGILFLGAHVVRSVGGFLALGIGLLLALWFFWSTVLLLLLFAASSSLSSVGATSVATLSLLFAPPQFPGLAV